MERTPTLRSLATEEQYHRVAAALKSSATVPEVNVGHVLDEYGRLHPSPAFVDVLLE